MALCHRPWTPEPERAGDIRMAYGQNQGQSNARPAFAGKTAAVAAPSQAASAAKGFEKDPSEVGIAYAKTSDKGGNYFSVSITADIPAGSKVMIFENKTKNRTEKTPTHVLKLSNKQG